MYCPNCGNAIPEGATTCPACQAPVQQAQGSDPQTQAPQPGSAQVPPYQPDYAQTPPSGQPGYTQAPPTDQPAYTQAPPVYASKNKIAAGLLAIFLGSLGIHKFYLGFTTPGIIYLLITIIGGAVTFGVASGVMGILALIEGILYLTKSDQDFYQLYEVQRKQWF